MSDALDYLLKVRQDAIKPYFLFLKKGGEHLDIKTRSLLSVITKIDAQTEAGFRQYLPRALQAGNTANEILDAMLVSMPILGFSKIVWAVDIILKMDIPEFVPEHLEKGQKWHKLVAVDEIAEGLSRFDYAHDLSCFVSRCGDDYMVFDSHCPHQATNIPLLALQDNVLTCPKHQWKFNVESGECIERGNRPLRKLQFRIENGFLFVYA